MSDRTRRSRAPIDTSGSRPPTPAEFTDARRIVAISGVLSVLQDRLDHAVGRPRSLSVEGLLVAMQINGLGRHHQGILAGFARLLNSLTDRQRTTLGITDWNSAQAYDRVDQLFNLIAKATEQGWDAVVDGQPVRIDADWVLGKLMAASLQDLPVWSSSIAVDGTDIDTWAKRPAWVDDVDIEFDEDDDHIATAKPPSKKKGKKKPIPAYGYDEEGGPIFTRDRDARWGHRSATSSRSSGSYIGYELHTAVLARDTGWSDGISKVKLGPDVPPVITMISLVPAGSKRDAAVVPKLIAAKEEGFDVDDVIWDRGYSQLLPENTSHPLNRAGISQTFRPKDHQRVRKPFRDDAMMIEGQLVSAHVPEELQGLLPMPPMKATAEESAKYEEPFNRLAQYRLERHAGPDDEGATRWRCPVCAGRLRSRQIPASMRRSRNTPLVDLPPGATCCNGIVTASAEELPHRQNFFPGTTAWRTSYNRRQVVEGVNGMMKGGFVNIQHKFFRVFGLTKMKLLLAFTVVGYNLEAIRSFLAKNSAKAVTVAKSQVKRKKRRKGTWTQILGSPDPSASDLTKSGRAPPPT